jgi:cobalamin biosynthesis protein CobD/CbiB
MGILLVYDVTDEASFNNIRDWMRNIKQHASDNVNKVICAAAGLPRYTAECAGLFAVGDDARAALEFAQQLQLCSS